MPCYDCQKIWRSIFHLTDEHSAWKRSNSFYIKNIVYSVQSAEGTNQYKALLKNAPSTVLFSFVTLLLNNVDLNFSILMYFTHRRLDIIN